MDLNTILNAGGKKMKVKGKEITENSTFKDLGLDSLDLLEIVLDVEGDLGVHFEDDQLIEFKTIKDVLVAVEGMKK